MQESFLVSQSAWGTSSPVLPLHGAPQVKWTTAAAVAAESSSISGDAPAIAQKSGDIEMNTAGGAAEPAAPEEAKPITAAAAAAVEARGACEGEETRSDKILADDPEKSAGDKKAAAVVEAEEAPPLPENQPGGETPSENGKKKPATEVRVGLVIG